MEQMLNRLRDTVSATVYQVTTNLSTALPGNPLTREYELIRQVGSAGPGLIFKIYEAQKKSTKENVSLFILEKKTDRLSKKEKESLFETIRHGVPQLARLRHPSMLTIQHNIEESRDLIAFATEPVIGSLANFFDPNFAQEEASKDDKFEFYDVEIKYGLLQLSEGLLFLHKDAKILHRNICPENIIVNRNGIWKISGFDFSTPTLNPNEQPYKFSTLKVIPDLSLEIQANFTYICPENFTDSNMDTSADIYSLGMVAYTLYNKGKPLLPFNQSYQYRPEKYASDIKERLSNQSTLSVIPEDFRKHFKLLLSCDPTLRPDAQQLSKLQIFQDVLVRTLQYFDSLFQWDSAQKSQFYKNLPEILTKMPKRVKLRRIVNGLAKEFVNPEMVPFVLPPMFMIAKETDDEEFHTWIVPELTPVFKYKEPIQIGIFLLKNMDFLVAKFKTKPDSLKEHIIPLIYRFLESEAYQIQELCLSVVPSIIHLIDYSGCKNMLLPRIKRLSLETKLLSVRVNCLICLGKVLEHLDKWIVLDEVLPLVMNMPSREPAVIMCSVGIFTLALNSNKLGITKEILATKVIPFLVPLSIENGLSLQQYNTIMNLIRDILNKIEEDHQAKLRQLDSIKVQQDSFFVDSQQKQNDLIPSQQNADQPFDPFQLGINSNKTESVTKNLNSLSLDEKERLQFEKEQTERLKNEQKMLWISSPNSELPSSSSLSHKPSTSHQTKDLTDMLINSNLNLMSRQSMASNQNFPSSNGFNNIGNHVQSAPSSSSSMNMFPPMMMTSHKTQPSNYSALDSIQIPNLMGPQQQKSSLNSLKSSTSSSQTSPIKNANLIMQKNSIMIPSLLQQNQTSSNTKQLSKSELEEFLN